MFRRGVWALAAMSAAAVMALAGAGASALAEDGTPAAYGLAQSLAGSQGLVVQKGAKNYAGPSCPGAGWTCTTSTQVLQVGADNQFECTASTGGAQTAPDTCLVVQSSTSGANRATCREKIGNPTGTQLCQIYQLNVAGTNSATVQQQIAAESGVTQLGEQSTEIGQWNDSGSNDASVNQDLSESQLATVPAGGSLTLTQDGFQEAVVGQHAGSGNNVAMINQALRLKQNASGGAAITELQDTDGSRYNTSAAVYQNSDQAGWATPSSTGTNRSSIKQINDLNARGAKTGDLTQQQGEFGNGIFAHVDQWSQGLSTSDNNQDEHQTLGASLVTGTLDQRQIGPLRWDPNQGTNPGNSIRVTQNSDQHADAGAYQSNEAEASCETSGTCTVLQTVANDKQRGTNSCGPASSCDISTRAVAGSGESDGVFTCDDSECTNPPYSPPENPLDPFNEANNICEFLPSAPPCNYYPD